MITAFLGNERAYLDTLRDRCDLRYVVGEPIDAASREVFGSSLEFAEERGIATMSPGAFLRRPPHVDLIVSAGFGRRIPLRVIERPAIGTINVHMSLLPAYRGRHPLNWAIINGERQTGVTIHHVSEGIDEGDIIAQEGFDIASDDTIMDVHRKAVRVGDGLLVRVLDWVGRAAFAGCPQSEADASYYPPRRPEDGRIDWSASAERIRDLVRALTPPYPGAFFLYDGERIVVDAAAIASHDAFGGMTGKLGCVDGSIYAAAGDGVLRLLRFRGDGRERLLRLLSRRGDGRSEIGAHLGSQG